MISVLFVCMGNICRSPLAEGTFRAQVDAAGLTSHFHIDSAGTIGFHAGNLPDTRSIEVARKNGLDITGQRSRKVRAQDFNDFEYIIAMDKENFANLMAICPESQQDKIHMFLPFDPDLNADEMPDPYYGGAQGFDYCFSAAMRASKALLTHIQRERKV